MNLFRFLFGIVVLVGLNNCGGSSGDEDTDILDTDLIDSTSVSSDVDDSIDDNNGIIEEDKTPPVITIFGDNPLVITQGETFSDPGATAVDNIDGEVAVTPIGSVDMSTAGSYNIIYTATDSAGNEANATRVVTVLANEVVWNVSNVTEFRQALEDAAANGENDKIVLEAGIYKTTSDGLGTFRFDDEEPFDLIIQSAEGLSRNDVILSGDSATQVFNFDNSEESTLILKRISIIDGNSTSNVGGGVYSKQNLKIEKCNFFNNKAKASGGGFFSGKNLTLIDSIVSENSVYNHGSNGGGFISGGKTDILNSTISYNYSMIEGGGFYSSGETTITDSNISHNKSEYSGGGFYVKDKTTVINSTINSNCAKFSIGGGFYSGNTKVVDSNIFSNYSKDSGGGFYGGNTEIANSKVYDNNSSGYGGGFTSAYLLITNTIVTNNIGEVGGGFVSSDAEIINSTINNNRGELGGGCYLGIARIISSKIFNNIGKKGGGFYSFFAMEKGAIIMTNSLIFNNIADNGAIFYSRSKYLYISNNNFIGNSGSFYSDDYSEYNVFINNIFYSNDNNIILRGNSKIYNNYIDYNKIIINESFNVIKKYNLQPSSVGDVCLNDDNKTLASNSPVIDKGLNPSSVTYKKIIDDDEIYNQLLELLTIDMVGNSRIYNGTIDMGAVEYGSK